MSITPLSLRKDYWETFNVLNTDLEFLYNHLLEIETPQTPRELAQVLVKERIQNEKTAIENQQPAEGIIYLPKNQYEIGQSLTFPGMNWDKGKVTGIRPGINPELPEFQVIEVIMNNGEKRNFAAGLQTHLLNQPLSVRTDDPLLNSDYVLKTYGSRIITELTESLEDDPDLVRIAGRWFPRALVVDVNIGHLNLAEAVLDMEGGGPLTTKAILEQIDLPTDVNSKLTEFSMNLALQEDGRFDEVGPSGEILWFLRRLEPEPVKNPPIYLRAKQQIFDESVVQESLKLLDPVICDELEPGVQGDSEEIDEIETALIFPHWRAGTLPLCNRMNKLFPSAYESPRIRFTFIDADSGQKIDGWVVRSHRYAYGLQDWYTSQGVFPGSQIRIRKGKNQGEVIIQAEKRRPTREWIRTSLIGADGGIVFAMLKQLVSTNFDEHLATAIPDLPALDQIWESGRKDRIPLENIVISMMRELAKLNPQGSVHAQDLYATVNMIRRCPPGPILDLLIQKPWSTHLGDLYFRLNETVPEVKVYE